MKIRSVLILLLSLLSLGSLLPIADAKSQVLIVPGYKGSRLRHRETGRLGWLDARFAFFRVERWRLQVQGLPSSELSWSDSTPYQADGILEQIPLLWGLTSWDIYARPLHDLPTVLGGGTEVNAFWYDWRNSIAASATELVARVQTGDNFNVHLVAHSMGGLVTLYALRCGTRTPKECLEQPPEFGAEMPGVCSVTIAGTPFGGSWQIAENLIHGEETVFRGMLLPAEVMQTFPSVYALIPSEERSRWMEQSPSVVPATEASLIMKAVQMGPDSRSLGKVSRVTWLNVVGTGQTALDRCQGQPCRVRGDQLVSVKSAQFPIWLEEAAHPRILRTNSDHGNLLHDKTVLREISQTIKHARCHADITTK